MRALKMVLLASAFIAISCNKSKTVEAPKTDNPTPGISIVKNPQTQKYEVKLGGQTLHELDSGDFSEPKRIGTFRSAPPYDSIILVEEFPMGNSCAGGDVHLIGIKGAQFSVLHTIPNCGASPVVNEKQNKIVFQTASASEVVVPFPAYIYQGGEMKDVSMPIRVSFRNSMSDEGLILVLKSILPNNLAIKLNIYDPGSDKETSFKLGLSPKGSATEFGHRQGWDFTSGQTLTMECEAYESFRIEVP